MDSDLPADLSAYRRVPVAQVWTALYLLSGAQDVEQHRHGGPTAAKRSIRSFIVINCVLFERVFLSSCVKDDSSCTRGKDMAVVWLHAQPQMLRNMTHLFHGVLFRIG